MVPVRPPIKILGDKLWPIVHLGPFGKTVLESSAFQPCDNIDASDPGTGIQNKTLTCEVLDHDKHSEAAIVEQLIRHEVHTPTIVPRQDCRTNLPLHARYTAPGHFLPHYQASRTVEAVDAFVVNFPALPARRDVKPTMAVRYARCRQLAHTKTERYLEISRTDGTLNQYAYDGNGVRVQKTVGSVYTWYVGGRDPKTEIVYSNSTSNPTYNIWAAENVGQVSRNGSTLTRYYYLKDHLGNIRMTVNSSGDVDGYADYYPFGQLMDGRSLVGSAGARYKFLTRERDSETGYDWLDARGYDSRIGKFLSVDPLEMKFKRWSPYAYSFDNPIRFFDPTGLAGDNPDEKAKKANEDLGQGGKTGQTGLKRIGSAIKGQVSFGAQIGLTATLENSNKSPVIVEGKAGDAVVVGSNLNGDAFFKTEAGVEGRISLPGVELGTKVKGGTLVDNEGARNYGEVNVPSISKGGEPSVKVEGGDNIVIKVGVQGVFLGSQVSVNVPQVIQGLKETTSGFLQSVNGLLSSAAQDFRNLIH